MLKMRIGGVDMQETTKIIKRMGRKEQDEQKNPRNQSTASEQSQPRKRIYPQSQNDDCPKYNTKRLKKTSQIADRYKIPDGAAAALVSAVLEDHGVVNETDSHQIVDRFDEIARERKRCRMEQIRQHKEQRVDLNALYFDSRVDSTKNIVGEAIKIQKEDHYSLVEHPGSLSLGFLTIKDTKKSDHTKAKIVAEDIKKFFQDVEKISMENLVTIGCDGTVLITGNRGGILKFLKEYLARTLQWISSIMSHYER